MAIDFKKCLDVAKMPIIILVAIQVVTFVIGLIPFLSVLLCLIGLPLTLIQFAILAWAGYKAVKEAGMDLVGGAVTGAVAGAVSGLVSGILTFVSIMLGVGGSMMGGGDSAGAVVGAGLGVIGGVIAIVVSPIIGAIMGLVFGAVGAFIAGMGKK